MPHWLLLSVLLSGLPVTAVQAESILEKIDRSLPAIVGIKARNPAFRKGDGQIAIPVGEHSLALEPFAAGQFERTGAGVLIDRKGLLVTNAHIVANADELSVILENGNIYEGKLLYTAADNDVAFLKAPLPAGIRPIPWGDSDALKLGDAVVTVGHSELLFHTISGGKITGLGTSRSEKEKGNADTALLQTSINLYKGDSGGPLLNHEGQLVGLMAAQETSGNFQSFAIPVNKIREQYDRFRSASEEP